MGPLRWQHTVVQGHMLVVQEVVVEPVFDKEKEERHNLDLDSTGFGTQLQAVDLEVMDTVRQEYSPDVDLVEVDYTDIVDRIDWLEAVAGILLPEAVEQAGYIDKGHRFAFFGKVVLRLQEDERMFQDQVGVVYIDLLVVGVAGSRIDPISALVVEEHTVPALESVDSEHIGLPDNLEVEEHMVLVSGQAAVVVESRLVADQEDENRIVWVLDLEADVCMFEVEMMGYIRFLVSGKTLGF